MSLSKWSQIHWMVGHLVLSSFIRCRCVFHLEKAQLAAAGRAGPTQKRCASWARARSAPLLAPRATTSTRGVTPGLPLVSAAFLLEFYNR